MVLAPANADPANAEKLSSSGAGATPQCLPSGGDAGAGLQAASATAGAALPSPQDARSAKLAERFFRPELDALRLIAFLMVWLAHGLPTRSETAAHQLAPAAARCLAAIKDAGNFGVCVFFFLSAYLITELLRRERLLTGTIHLRAFYLRRILRIWPLYLGVLAAYALLGLRFHGFRIEPGRLLASVLLAGNWYIAWHPAILTPMRALWSLSVEEQFYLGWPLLVRKARPAVVAAAAIGFVALGQATLLWLARPSAHAAALHVTAWVNSLVEFQFFALGALAALVLRGQAPRLGGLPRALLALAAAAALLIAADTFGIKREMGWHSGLSLTAGYLLVSLACGLLFAAILGLPEQHVPRWAVSLGRVSFGLYVFHETGFFLADALLRQIHARLPGASAELQAQWALTLTADKLLSLAFTVVLALLSYRYWERPFLRLKERFTFARSREA